MAENENGQDRTEQPTQKRLDEARQNGQVPRSRELTTAAVVLAAGIGLRYSGAAMATGFATMMKSGLTLSREQALDENLLLPNLVALGWQGLLVTGADPRADAGGRAVESAGHRRLEHEFHGTGSELRTPQSRCRPAAPVFLARRSANCSRPMPNSC